MDRQGAEGEGRRRPRVSGSDKAVWQREEKEGAEGIALNVPPNLHQLPDEEALGRSTDNQTPSQPYSTASKSDNFPTGDDEHDDEAEGHLHEEIQKYDLEGERETPTTSRQENRFAGHQSDARREEEEQELLGPTDTLPASFSERPDYYHMGQRGDAFGGRRPSYGLTRHTPDMRKIVDTGTPTLVEEADVYNDVEDEDYEMAQLEHERIRRFLTSTGHQVGSAAAADEYDPHRRTPGAKMYTSTSFDQDELRRTPGASKMHASVFTSTAHPDPSPATIPDTSGLGFGLTLASPLAMTSSSSVHAGKGIDRSAFARPKPPFPPNAAGGQHNSFVSPWSTVKSGTAAPDSSSGRVMSPNTLRLSADLGRLSADLGSLLLDDDGSDESQERSNRLVFGGGSSMVSGNETDRRGQSNDSWTTAYVANLDAPTRVPRSLAGRGRRGRADTLRRARGGSSFQRPGGFLPHAQQPTPLRNVQLPSAPEMSTEGNEPFGQGAADFSWAVDNSFNPTFGDAFFGNASAPSNSGPVNFGGAFSPLAKTNAQESHQQSITFASVAGPSIGPPPSHSEFVAVEGGQSAFSFGMPPSNAPPPGFALPPYHQSQERPNFGGSNEFQQAPAHTPKFGGDQGRPHAPTPMFGGEHPPASMNQSMNQAPNFAFQHQRGLAYSLYHGNPGIVHPVPIFSNNYMPAHPHAQQPPPHFTTSPFSWPQPPQMQYEEMPADKQQFAMESQGGRPSGNWSGGGGVMDSYPVYATRPLGATNPSYHPSPFPAGPTATPWMMVSSEPTHDVANTQSTNPFAGMAPAARPAGRGRNQRRNPARKKWTTRNRIRSTQDMAGTTAVSGEHGMGFFASSSTSDAPDLLPTDKPSRKKPPMKGRATPPLAHGDRPPSAASLEAEQSAGVDDLADAKRAELTESPAIRSAFKDFYRRFRVEEKSSFHDAEEFAMSSLKDSSLPESVHWKVLLELADLAKRTNRFDQARNLYHQVCSLQPYASQGWIDFSKLEEECGNMASCSKILRTGLEYCQYNEALLTRAIKHEEKVGNLSRARELLSRLKHIGIEKVWRAVLEGALMEARSGNEVMARRVLKYLMHHVPWYGPLYLEAFKLERDLGNSRNALAIVERGLAAIPRYGPLWFGGFRLCEEIDWAGGSYGLTNSLTMIDRATRSISKELLWKVHLEAAQMLERSCMENLDSTTDPTLLQIVAISRKRFAMTSVTCPPNLRWKVWLAAGRMEVAAGNVQLARRLFQRAHKVVPDKGRPVALLECARLEEYAGDVPLAKAILYKSLHVGGSDWKVWLESVLLATRGGNYTQAIRLSENALHQHSGTGRLWACLIQLHHFVEGEKLQLESLTLALSAVPKSGEVWCEGARIHLNPFSQTFDPQRASKYLYFATKFTPQYGDGFLESLRLLIVDQLLRPIASVIWGGAKQRLILEDGLFRKDDLVNFIFKILLELRTIDDSSLEIVNDEAFLVRPAVESLKNRVYSDASYGYLDLAVLERQCTNADPNYGPLWFYCRKGPTDTARKVLARASGIVLADIENSAAFYIAAYVRRFALLAAMAHTMKQEGNNPKEGTAEWEVLIDRECLAAPSLTQIIQTSREKREPGMELLERSAAPSDFITGIVAMNRYRPVDEMTMAERRRMLFGADSLF